MPHPLVEPTDPPRAAYIHVPFCRHRCGYCNFTVVAGRDDLIARYLDGLRRELEALRSPRPVETLFLGGGTPTHLPTDQLARLLGLVEKWFPLVAGGEFSIEANPRDIEPDKLAVLARFGVNRISLGGQSFTAQALTLLERDHSPEQLAGAIALCQESIASVNVDLIFAVPGQTLADWQTDLDRLIALRPQHVSTYGLTFERGTRFWSRRITGSLAETDDELWRAQYSAALEALPAAGYEHYEVSNFAQPGHGCRHNQAYWSGQAFYAAGPGAARYVEGRRETNHRSLWTWLKRLEAGESPTAEVDELPPADRARELAVFALRRVEGVDRRWFRETSGFDLDELIGDALPRAVDQGLLEDTGNGVRLTRQGLFVSDALWPEFLAGE